MINLKKEEFVEVTSKAAGKAFDAAEYAYRKLSTVMDGVQKTAKKQVDAIERLTKK